jgi:hypothetical protein
LDNVTLLPGIDFYDIMAEGLQKFDEANEKASEKYNRHFFTLTARNRLYHWYSQPLDQFSPPVYLNVAGEAVFAPKKPRRAARALLGVLRKWASLTSASLGDAESNSETPQITEVLDDERRRGSRPF